MKKIPAVCKKDHKYNAPTFYFKESGKLVLGNIRSPLARSKSTLSTETQENEVNTLAHLPRDEILRLLHSEKDKLEKLECTMRSSEAVTDEMEMEHDEQSKYVNTLKEQHFHLSANQNVNVLDDCLCGPDEMIRNPECPICTNEKKLPLRVIRRSSSLDENYLAKRRIPQAQYLISNGYDPDMFRDLFYMGSLKWECEPNKWINVIVMFTYQQEFHVLEEPRGVSSLTKDTKSQLIGKKNIKRKPILTVNIKGCQTMLMMGDQTKFSLLERRSMNTNHYGDRQYQLYGGSYVSHNFQTETTDTTLAVIEKIGQALIFGEQTQEVVRVVHCLYITVKTAILTRREKHVEYSTRIFLDTLEEGHTQWCKPTKQGEVNWMEQFAFDGIPTDTKNVTIVILRKSLGTLSSYRIKEIGRVTLSGQAFRHIDKKAVGTWYDLDDHTGKLLIEPNFTFQKIYPSSEYNAVREILNTMVTPPLDEALSTVRIMLEALKKTPAQAKANISIALTRYFMAMSSHVQFLQLLGMAEVDSTEDPFTLFRGNSVCSKALDFYMNFVGNVYLKETVGAFVQKICQIEQPCEVDPVRLGRNDNLAKNWDRLYKLVGSLCSDIFKSADKCPIELKLIFQRIRIHAEKRFGVDADSTSLSKESSYFSSSQGNEYSAQNPKPDVHVLQAVSGFIFLRFFSAALVSPSMFPFRLVKDIPSTEAKRTLTILSKVLTKLANLALFSPNEAYLMPLNEYMEKENLFSKMRQYLLQVSTVADPDTVSLDFGYSMDAPRIVAHVHRLFTNLYLEGYTSDFIKKVMDTVHWDQIARRDGPTETARLSTGDMLSDFESSLSITALTEPHVEEPDQETVQSETAGMSHFTSIPVPIREGGYLPKPTIPEVVTTPSSSTSLSTSLSTSSALVIADSTTAQPVPVNTAPPTSARPARMRTLPSPSTALATTLSILHNTYQYQKFQKTKDALHEAFDKMDEMFYFTHEYTTNHDHDHSNDSHDPNWNGEDGLNINIKPKPTASTSDHSIPPHLSLLKMISSKKIPSTASFHSTPYFRRSISTAPAYRISMESFAAVDTCSDPSGVPIQLENDWDCLEDLDRMISRLDEYDGKEDNYDHLSRGSAEETEEDGEEEYTSNTSNVER